MPLEEYYEEIDKFVEPEKKEPEIKKPLFDYKLALYLGIFIILILFLILQFVSAYFETTARKKTIQLIPIVYFKIKAVGLELDDFCDKNEFYPAGLERFELKKKFFNYKGEDIKIYYTDKTIILDPFTDDKKPFHYRLGHKSVSNFQKHNPLGKVLINPFFFWTIYSVGPDKKDNNGEVLYDPTNGIISQGDIVVWSLRGRYIKPSPKIKGKTTIDSDF